MIALQTAWMLLIGILLAGYAILDGFDLGIGLWYAFAKREGYRRVLLGIIGPVWDGNEVWLITGGASIFAAFPPVYATVFSGFYLALMLVLFALMLRAVAIEFRNQSPDPRWRKAFDAAFIAGSVLPMLLFGVALGNVMRGLPLDARGEYAGNFFTPLNPYALLIGLTGFSMLATHGALYTALKTDEGLEAQAKVWARNAWWAYISLFLISSAVTAMTQPQLMANFKAHEVLWLAPGLALVSALVVGLSIFRGKSGTAFSASAISIAALFAVVGASLYPNMVPALGTPSRNLTIMNSSSSFLTLKTMLTLALVGMPIVIGYTIWIYHTFRGKVRSEDRTVY